ncbi:hypothetical protein [Shinella sp.]|uniref:hypothetical protein n=1 Tax=Shinella sp. TaxID=1870904 RepID=UPI0028ACA927|nr:hypothetical protein [Shinella sp.]
MSTETHTIPDDMAAHYESLVTEAEKMRQAGADALKAAYADLRADLKQLGWAGASISAEVAAFKGAIAEMALAEADKTKRDEKGERIDDYVSLLTRARARGQRKIDERFDPTTGEFVDDNEASDGSPSVSSSLTTREAEESVVSNNSRPAALAVSGGEPSIPSPDAGGEKMDGCSHPGRSDETSAYCNAQSGQATNTIPQSDDGAIAAVNGKAGLANADGVEPPSSDRPADQPLKGGDHEVTGISMGERDIPTSNTGEGAANTALPADGIVMEYVPPTGMKRLPFAHCFPDHSKAEYERLEKDIAANRVREPIIRQGDVIVDGWARYNISRAYGMSYPVLELHPGRDVLLDLIEWQRASRNFTPAQQRKITAELVKEFPHRADDIMAAFGLAEALEAAE